MEKQGLSRLKRLARHLPVVAAFVALGAATTLPALAQEKRSPAVSVRVDRAGTFTPAGADPRLAAALADRDSPARAFRFTPAAAKDRPAQLRVAVRAGSNTQTASTGNRRGESVAAAPSVANSLTPTSYNLGVAVGWKRFAVSGDVASTDSADPRIDSRDSAVVGLNYNLKRFTGRVSLSADRQTRTIAPTIAPRESYALDVGGAVKVGRNVAVTGGVRYRIDQDRLNDPTQDTRQDSQAVYVGTAVKF